VGAEGFAPPAVVVDEAALGDEPTGVVIDPVAGKGAGADQPRLGAAVDVDGQGLDVHYRPSALSLKGLRTP
jgi:hypothetical protein